MNLVYYGDPMCSWCYGFGPELAALLEARPDVPLRIRFNREAFLARTDFVYDTEPVSRAVVAARIVAPQAPLLEVFRALQHGFYVDGFDTTRAPVLVQLVAAALERLGHPVHIGRLAEVFYSDDARRQTATDFALARRAGVASFPTLTLESDGMRQVVSPGDAQVDELVRRLDALLPQRAPAG